MSKIKIESHGISPWHYFLETMSWRDHRKQNDDTMAFLNVDPDLINGGRGLEDVLMADFLQNLDFADRSLLDDILKIAQCSAKLKEAEIRGNAGNYYLPYEDKKDGIRLAQPDGWIADKNTLILLEAKGHRTHAAINHGQLAKEYLISQNVAQHTDKTNFFVLIIAEDFNNVYRKFSLPIRNEGDQNVADTFAELWKANVDDFIRAYETRLQDECNNLKKLTPDDVFKHFLWITWDQIAATAAKNKIDFYAEQITRSIAFHSGKNNEQSIFSQCLTELAEEKVPLYHFYNGGCGDDILQKYEEIFLQKRPNPWEKWHNLAKEKAELFSTLSELEERRRIILSQQRKADKEIKQAIKQFYKDFLPQVKAAETTRKAFEILGEYTNIEKQNQFSFFEQRMPKIQYVKSMPENL